MKIKYIKENLLTEHSVDFLVESSKEVVVHNNVEEVEKEDAGTGTTFLQLTGVFQKGNVPNGNKRIYTTELLARETKKFQAKIKRGTSLGKGYHPGLFDVGGPAGVTDVTHRITKTWLEGDVVKGELIVLKTSKGKEEIEPIIAGGGTIGISSRGYGSMEFHEKYEIAGKSYKNVYVVGENYELVTYDLVLTPSVSTAMMKQVKESNEIIDLSNKQEEIMNEEVDKSMTIEELKSLHPELYNMIRDAAMKEGATEARDLAVTDHKKITDAQATEIKELKVANEGVIAANESLTKNVERLKEEKKQVESDKLAVDVKTAVREAIGKSEFKSYFNEEAIAHIASISDSVEIGVKEVGAREEVYKKVIENYKATSTSVVNSGSNITDTSENNATGVKNTEKSVEDFNESQRELAFSADE